MSKLQKKELPPGVLHSGLSDCVAPAHLLCKSFKATVILIFDICRNKIPRHTFIK